ncbi:MAG: hypothetical protein KA104_03155, partial [Candidatus Pacebacteria bacterium]|nr:hypothetical protein [Candidatus Paceibacterota bacterium]
MNISSVASLDKLAKEIVQVRITEKPKGTKRVVREDTKEFLEVGVGKKSDVTQRTFIPFVRSIIQNAKREKIKKIALDAMDFRFDHMSAVTDEELGSLIAQNMLMANYEFTVYKAKPKDGFREVSEVLIANSSKEMQAGVKKGIAIGEEVNACRTLANTPGGDMTPQGLAKAAKMAVAGLP